MKRIQPHVTRAAFLGHTHHLLVHSLLRPEKPPLGSEPPPWLCLGAHSPLAWPVPLTAPAGSPGAPTTRGRLSALSWGGLRGVRFKKQQVLVGPPTHSTAASTRLPTSFLWMGPGWVQGPTVHPRSHLIPVLPTGKSLSYSACFTERVLIHTPLPGAQGSAGQAPPRAWGSPGQVPAGLSTQEPSTGPSLQSTPSPPVG